MPMDALRGWFRVQIPPKGIRSYYKNLEMLNVNGNPVEIHDSPICHGYSVIENDYAEFRTSPILGYPRGGQGALV